MRSCEGKGPGQIQAQSWHPINVSFLSSFLTNAGEEHSATTREPGLQEALVTVSEEAQEIK